MPDTPTIDALISEVEDLAAQAVETLKANPRVAEVQQRFAELQSALADAKADEATAPPA